MAIPPKDPEAILDYGVDWSAWLEGDSITTSTWTVTSSLTDDPTPLAIDTSKPATSDGKATKVWVRGGSVGASYRLTNRIVTTAGRQDERTITLGIRQL